jgi:hypothetical protein
MQLTVHKKTRSADPKFHYSLRLAELRNARYVRQKFRYKPPAKPKNFRRSYLRTLGQIYWEGFHEPSLGHNHPKFCSWRTTIRLLYSILEALGRFVWLWDTLGKFGFVRGRTAYQTTLAIPYWRKKLWLAWRVEIPALEPCCAQIQGQTYAHYNYHSKGNWPAQFNVTWSASPSAFSAILSCLRSIMSVLL